ncbi:MAG: right-handed parallel beta-helix repeat-containing protein, partial [Pseudomonadales bacterium]|nr:right-handed parallel beta-helix repeat-containing protein [Pseudomonadales bacterium]
AANQTASGYTIPDNAIMIEASDDITTAAKEALILAESGAVIVFPKGKFNISDTLSFDGDSDGDGVLINNVTIMGYGMNETELNFENSVGGDGFFVQNANNITFRDIKVTEAPNNAIKVKDSDGVYFNHTSTVWEGELDEGNGAYGLYPVETRNVLIENSYVRGSADAGIYVGQSENIVVRNNTAEENVAGIEIENSKNADVYNNVANNNTGGILVFDLPIGNGHYGSTVRVFNNEVANNNTDNFANSSANPAGVHIVPPGTGVIILSTRDVEIYNNTITGHDTFAVALSSFFLADGDVENFGTNYGAILADGWRPVPRNINLHNNTINGFGTNPRGDLVADLIQGYQATAGAVPAVLYDGIGELLANAGAIAAMGETPFAADGSENICVADNGEHSIGVVYATDPTTLGAFDENMMPQVQLQYEARQTELQACDPTPERLPAATVTFNGTQYGCGKDDNHPACSL